MDIQGIDPRTSIEVSVAERLLVGIGVAALSVAIAIGSFSVGVISLVGLAVCLVLMLFRADRSKRRSAVKLYPGEDWAEYDQIGMRQVLVSVGIFVIVYCAALIVNLVFESGSTIQFIGALVVGCLGLIGIFFLPVFTASTASVAEGDLTNATDHRADGDIQGTTQGQASHESAASVESLSTTQFQAPQDATQR